MKTRAIIKTEAKATTEDNSNNDLIKTNHQETEEVIMKEVMEDNLSNSNNCSLKKLNTNQEMKADSS